MRLWRLVAAFLLILAICPAAFSQDSDGDGIPDTVESYLAEKFAPVIHLHPDEALLPVGIEYALNNSELLLKKDGSVQLVDHSPTPESLSRYNSSDSRYFLDNIHGGIDDTGVIDHFKSLRGDLPPVVYARVISGGNASSKIVQYWFYYPFNNGPLNSHEGDWEMIQVRLEGEEAISASYSQHFSGQTAQWKDVLLRDEHPIVYVALGSHANYFRSYQGVLGGQSDKVSGSGQTLEPDNYQLVLLGELGDHPASQGWLDFSGRWGEWGGTGDELRGRRGPSGPGHGDNWEKWGNPLQWASDLPELNTKWLWLSWLVANFVVLFSSYVLIRGVWKLFGLGRAVWNRHVLKGLGVGAALAILGAFITVLGILQPWFFVNLNVSTGSFKTAGEATLLLLDGSHGLQINDPESNRGLVTLFGLRMPLGFFLLSGLIFLVLDTLGAKSGRKLRWRYIRSGLSNVLIPVVPIILFVLFLGPAVAGLVQSRVGELPASVGDMISSVSKNPLGGFYEGDVEDIGTVNLRWGLGPGSFLIVAGGLLKVLGGILSGLLKVLGGILSRGEEEEEPRGKGAAQQEARPQVPATEPGELPEEP